MNLYFGKGLECVLCPIFTNRVLKLKRIRNQPCLQRTCSKLYINSRLWWQLSCLRNNRKSLFKFFNCIIDIFLFFIAFSFLDLLLKSLQLLPVNCLGARSFVFDEYFLCEVFKSVLSSKINILKILLRINSHSLLCPAPQLNIQTLGILEHDM